MLGDMELTKYFGANGEEITQQEYESLIEEIGTRQVGENVSSPITINFASRLNVPKGFQYLASGFPSHFGFEYDVSNLSCIKEPIVSTARTDTGNPNLPLEYHVVGGYRIRVLGTAVLLANAPITATKPLPFSNTLPVRISCSNTIPVNHVIGFTCDPLPYLGNCFSLASGLISWSESPDHTGSVFVTSSLTFVLTDN